MKMGTSCVVISKMKVLSDVSFFPIDDWEFRIWWEAKIWLRKSDMFEIVIHVAPSWFFIRTDNKAHALRNRES